MAKRNFKIRAKFVFGGEMTVSAATRQEAEAIAAKGLHARLGSVNVDPVSEDKIKDWSFGVHADTVINRKEDRANE